jgi:dCTP deaminase
MATLPDFMLRAWGEGGGVVPYNPERVNPASLNLEIGPTVLIEGGAASDLRDAGVGGAFTAGSFDWETGLHRLDMRELPSGYLKVPPGGWVLAEVAERVTIPPTMEGVICLRSSAARIGWDHCLAGYVDPGYSGRLTLELVNCRRDRALPLAPGMLLVQLRLSLLAGTPEQHYGSTGRYQGDEVVRGCADRSLEVPAHG